MSHDKLIIIVPCQDRIVPEVDQSLRVLEAEGIRVHRAYYQSAIDASRCRLATQALEAGYQELLWIDSDVGFDPKDVDRLRQHGLPMVGGIYTKKGAKLLASGHGPDAPPVLFEPAAVPIEVRYLPGGFLYTRAEVYAAIQKRFCLPRCNQADPTAALVPYFMPTLVNEENGPVYLSEDYAFSHRAREAGFRVMADPGIRLSHYGMHGWTVEDAVQPRQSLPRVRLSFLNGSAPAGSDIPTNSATS